MSWKLWLDDMINDPDVPLRHVPEGFIGAENVDQAIALVEDYGCMPVFMDLDHDLADGKDAISFLRWLSEYRKEDQPIPEYRVHSENPIGKKNVESFMESWKRSINMEDKFPVFASKEEERAWSAEKLRKRNAVFVSNDMKARFDLVYKKG